mgnify:CR=1 FL=1
MGPLKDINILEFSGIGPGPYCGMLLADMGANVIRICRKDSEGLENKFDIHNRSKRSMTANLKNGNTIKEILKLIDQVDVVFEGYRPGVMEKLGLGPDICLERNPKLVYGRMTGWGQEGPMSNLAGHDINYISLSGALHAIGRKDSNPIPPLNLVADYGGGSMFLIFGILAALYERALSGKGQTIDAAMVDGVPAMMGLFHQQIAKGSWTDGERQSNLLDGGAPFYRCYECSDGKFISVGALEPQFFAELVEIVKLPEIDLVTQNDRTTWAEKNKAYEKIFKSKSRDEWSKIFEGTDACVTPI